MGNAQHEKKSRKTDKRESPARLREGHRLAVAFRKIDDVETRKKILEMAEDAAAKAEVNNDL